MKKYQSSNYTGLRQAIQAKSKTARAGRRSQKSGVILLLACFCMPLLMALMGLAVDTGILYSLKTKLQMSVDGAAIAGIRAVSLTQSVSQQQGYVDTIASNFFNANFTSGYLGTNNTVLTTPQLSAPAGAQTVTVTARTDVPSYFMKYFARAATTITATGVASRQAANIMMVLDRSGSMDSVANTASQSTGNPPTAKTSGSPCDKMVIAAKQFTGIFTPGYDRIGLVSFAEAVSIDSSPSTSFQTTLGYSNGTNTGTGKLDSIVCWGGTNTSTALAVAWNELYKNALPGANNFILLVTDGEPTAGTFDLSPVIKSSSYCRDTRGYAANGRNSSNQQTSNYGDFTNYETNWAGTDSNATTNGDAVITLGTNSYWSPFKGMIGAIYASTSPSNVLTGVAPWFVPTGVAKTSQENKPKTAAVAPGCAFPSNASSVGSDILRYPATDIFGSSTSGYRGSSTTLSASNGSLVNFNLADNIGQFIRGETAASQAVNYSNGGPSMPPVTIHVIGLGGNGAVDTTLLQRLANNNQTSTGPAGKYYYAPDGDTLSAAFYSMGSNVMRLSQ